jgi:DNA polymerase III subunit gamma/tau
MNLISIRPTTWNEVVAQDRVVSLLKSLLTIGKFLPQGFILKGAAGLGKTSVSYLLARALMCSGDDPLGCGKCISCRVIDKEGIEHHPDFFETDAASKPSVQDAHDLTDFMSQPPINGHRRIALIDMAHRLSSEAWDVLLKPLEETSPNSLFIFVTTDEDLIPYTIRSRTVPLGFFPATEEVVTGLLASMASRNGIDYELEALKDIAQHSRGIIRNAVRWLGVAASLGKVTRDSVDHVLDNPLDSLCLSALLALAFGDQKAATKAVDDAGRMAPPVRVIETLFCIYARSPWCEPGSELSRVAAAFPNIRETSSVFLKWLGTTLLPADALPLFVHELMGIAKTSRPSSQRAEPKRVAPKGTTNTRAVLRGEVI